MTDVVSAVVWDAHPVALLGISMFLSIPLWALLHEHIHVAAAEHVTGTRPHVEFMGFREGWVTHLEEIQIPEGTSRVKAAYPYLAPTMAGFVGLVVMAMFPLRSLVTVWIVGGLFLVGFPQPRDVQGFVEVLKS